MQRVHSTFNNFKTQSHDENHLIRIQQLNNEIQYLNELKLALPLKYQNKSQSQSSLKSITSDRQQIDKYIQIYRLAIRQIQRMKLKFTKPSLVNKRIAEIFDQEIQDANQLNLSGDKSQAIKSSEIQFPSFKKPSRTSGKELIINDVRQTSLNSPQLRQFFQKKQNQIMNRTNQSHNFKQILKSDQKNRSNLLSVSREHMSNVSRSSASSFKRRANNINDQFKKIQEENKRVREDYQKKLRKQHQLNEFEKRLLKQEKNRYMMKIQQLEAQLQNLCRENYKLKQQQQVSKIKQHKQNQSKQFQTNESFLDVNENVKVGQMRDYYQPYVMNTKHNDLKKLMNSKEMKIVTVHVPEKDNVMSQLNFKSNGNSEMELDILGNELEREIKQLQRERSRTVDLNNMSKKQSQNSLQQQPIFRTFQQGQHETKKTQPIKQTKYQNPIKNLGYNQTDSDGEDDMILKDLELLEEKEKHKEKQKEKTFNSNHHKVIKVPDNLYSARTTPREEEELIYKPVDDYSFTRNKNQAKQYSITSTPNNFSSFQMTRTYLDLEQGEQSITNKYIDSKTSTRNKVAFFKDSLILIKNNKFQLAYKKSSLIQPSKDRYRVIFFIKNKTQTEIKVNFNYEYDAGYFKLKVNEKIISIKPQSQGKQDLEVYHYSQLDLNQVIDVLLEVDGQKYGLWLPILWIQFKEIENFKMPMLIDEISILPDRQFKSYETAKTILPLMFGGIDGIYQWAYLYGSCKFGHCFIKLTWESRELKIQANGKWIDLLAFVLHHVK